MAETMSSKVIAALQAGAKNLAEVSEKTGLPRPKAYATLHQLKLEGKAVRSGPRGWERAKWALLTSDAANTTEVALAGENPGPASVTRAKSAMKAAAVAS